MTNFGGCKHASMADGRTHARCPLSAHEQSLEGKRDFVVGICVSSFAFTQPAARCPSLTVRLQTARSTCTWACSSSEVKGECKALTSAKEECAWRSAGGSHACKTVITPQCMHTQRTLTRRCTSSGNKGANAWHAIVIRCTGKALACGCVNGGCSGATDGQTAGKGLAYTPLKGKVSVVVCLIAVS
jgi:hypothetical protein